MLIKTHSHFLMVILCLTFLSCNKQGNTSTTPVAVVPVVKIDNASLVRTTATGTMHFNVTLDRTTTVPVSVDYTVTDGTATSAKDYTATSGTLTIPVNQANAEVTVLIKGDPTDTRQQNIDFNITLSNPKNCTIGGAVAKGTIVLEDGTNFITNNSGFSTPLTYPGYTLIWNDEFSGTALDANTWNYETGNGSGGWGNHELEYYTNSTKNVFVSNGNLIIEARNESIGGFNYSSGRLTTQTKKSFTYGRVDIRAKLPKGKGVWPALWMLGNNINTVGWPAGGEIDIMELLGQEPSKMYSTLHYGTSPATHAQLGNSYSLSGSSFYDQFHVFSMEWKLDQIKLYVDNNLLLTVNKTDVGSNPYPFNAPFFFIFNVAVGGDWPGAPDGSTTLPQRMIVDYIRVFQ